MRQACYFAEVCDGEFNEKHIGITLFPLHICVREQMMKIICEKGTQSVSICWGYFLKSSG